MRKRPRWFIPDRPFQLRIVFEVKARLALLVNVRQGRKCFKGQQMFVDRLVIPECKQTMTSHKGRLAGPK